MEIVEFNGLKFVGCCELVMVVEEFFGSVVHLTKFCRGNLLEGGAVLEVLTVFYFGEKDFIIFDRNDVDFVSFGLEISSDDNVPL